MILLPQQIRAVIYYFIGGWIYAFLYKAVKQTGISLTRFWIREILELLYSLCFTLGFYLGSVRIIYGKTRLILIVFFLLGVMVYLQFYDDIFENYFARAGKRMEKQTVWLRKDEKSRGKLAFYKVFSIMKMHRVFIFFRNRRQGRNRIDGRK